MVILEIIPICIRRNYCILHSAAYDRITDRSGRLYHRIFIPVVCCHKSSNIWRSGRRMAVIDLCY